MAKFRFSLETVEKVRRNTEQAALRVLAEAQRGLQAALNHKAQLVQRLEEGLKARQEAPDGEGASPYEIATHDQFVTGTKQRIIQADQATLRARRQLDKCLRTFLDARKRTRMIEVLREKGLEEFKREQAKREQRQLDDLMIMRQRLGEESA